MTIHTISDHLEQKKKEEEVNKLAQQFKYIVEHYFHKELPPEIDQEARTIREKIVSLGFIMKWEYDQILLDPTDLENPTIKASVTVERVQPAQDKKLH